MHCPSMSFSLLAKRARAVLINVEDQLRHAGLAQLIFFIFLLRYYLLKAIKHSRFWLAEIHKIYPSLLTCCSQIIVLGIPYNLVKEQVKLISVQTVHKHSSDHAALKQIKIRDV